MPFRYVCILCTFLLLTGCFRVGEELEPQLNASVQDRYLKSLPSAFPALSTREQGEAWASEYRIGVGFAQELDLYQALTAFKRASFLSPPLDRMQQLNYDAFFAYYLGSKFPETLYAFESTSLKHVSPEFPPYHDLLLILYDSQFCLDQTEEADTTLHYLSLRYPETAQKLILSKLLVKGEITALEKEAPSHSQIQTLLARYNQEKKSTATAQTLNAVLPGAGYLYLGQKQSAITAFFLNGLFIWASVYFFQHGNIAAGAIFTSVEAGWYFGGIYGAGQEAKLYNERVYERHATPLMNENRLFPILMLNYGF